MIALRFMGTPHSPVCTPSYPCILCAPCEPLRQPPANVTLLRKFITRYQLCKTHLPDRLSGIMIVAFLVNQFYALE